MISNAELNTIFELDLDPIKVKLMHKESGEGWSLDQANAVEFEYRRFLCLMKLFPDEQTAPLFDVDIFWHYHILDTMKYAADCEQVFGYFLHHFPYVGLRGEDDEAAHHQVGARMKELYEATFGQAYIRQDEAQAVTAKTAWSSAAVRAKTAWSSAAAKTAWSSAAAKTAWSSAAAKTAWSSAAAKTAWSSAAVGASGARAQAVANDATCIETGFSTASQAAAAQAQRFYSDRPTLAKSA